MSASAGVPIAVGVSGWSYDDWKGIVYPPGCRDTLRAVASRVDFVEINVSFYRTPSPDTVRGWVERTADLGTRFTAKLPQRATHDGVLDAAEIDAFRAALQPLADSGRLVALLAQFSWRLAADAGAFAQLDAIARAYGGLAPLLLEVRHASWRALDAQRTAVELGYRPIHLDYPGADRGFTGPDAGVERVVGIEYFRLHGRNQKAWFDKDAGRDATYDWLYGADELDEIERRIRAIAALASAATVMVAANNHFRGQAMVAALQLGAWAQGKAVDVPATMLGLYPQLSGVARARQRGLFDA
ncbi:MAG: DUF72 domain-containing protein [Planctomycetes bacterium]|nr:DUF72 domain-containing protein [Planctomycetota bacterium]